MADKKGQIQNAETIIVIIIVTILMVIGAVFAIRYKGNNTETEKKDLNEEEAMKVVIVASSLNELRCSEYSAMIKTCFDYQRLLSFSKIVTENRQDSFNYYHYLFGNSRISIQIITGDIPPENRNILLYDYDDAEGKSSSPVFIPVIVMNSLTKESYFSVLEVRTYS